VLYPTARHQPGVANITTEMYMISTGQLSVSNAVEAARRRCQGGHIYPEHVNLISIESCVRNRVML
jgi:hypothetical protein